MNLPLDLYLTSTVAVVLFIIAVVSGYNFRGAWKREERGIKIWLFGGTSLVCLLTLAFVPIR